MSMIEVTVRLRLPELVELSWALRRVAAQADDRAQRATHRSWMVKSQATADRYAEKIAEHRALSQAATAVADALDHARRGQSA